jgi:hypothetical protein
MIFFKTDDAKQPTRVLKVELYDLTYLGVLAPPEGVTAEPRFLFSARPCENCIEDLGIYALRPSGGKPETFVHPGKIHEAKSRALVLESRAFFGKCARDKDDVLIIFQRERVDRRHGLQPSVLIAKIGPDYMVEKLIERRMPRLQDTLSRVRRKSCTEIEGRTRLMISKSIALRKKGMGPVEDEEEKEDDERAAR